MANSSWQLCNSQNVEEIIMNLQYFWKNVNKQLKSADFLSEMSKFQKNLLNKVLASFILMSNHTIVFVVPPPNSQECHTSTHVLLLTPYTFEEVPVSKFFIFHSLSPIFEFYEKKYKINWAANWQKLKKQQNK